MFRFSLMKRSLYPNCSIRFTCSGEACASMVATVFERTESISPTDEARRSMSEDTFAIVGLYDQGYGSNRVIL